MALKRIPAVEAMKDVMKVVSLLFKKKKLNFRLSSKEARATLDWDEMKWRRAVRVGVKARLLNNGGFGIGAWVELTPRAIEQKNSKSAMSPA